MTKMSRFVGTLSFLVFVLIMNLVNGQEIISLDHEYTNLSTKGRLIPNLYILPLDQRQPVRVVLTSENSQASNPLVLEAVKGRNVLNAHLPMLQRSSNKSYQYWFSSNTICENGNYSFSNSGGTLKMLVASAHPVFYTLKVKSVHDYDIGEIPFNTKATPSEPRLYRYIFPDNVEKVTIKVQSDTDICGRIMARTAVCPVFDSSGMVYFNLFYFQIFGAMIPALTTLFDNRHWRFEQMNLDACNVNFLCSYEIFGFTSFNSMVSASSLVFVGGVNLLIVFRRKIFRYSEPYSCSVSNQGLTQLDAPKIVCLLSMIALGVFWTITWSCRKSTTLHLYVYTVSWVCLSAMMLTYSKRHGIRKWQQKFVIVVSTVVAVFTFCEKNLIKENVHDIIAKACLALLANSSMGYFCFNYYYERPSGIRGHQWIGHPFEFGEKFIRNEKEVYQPLKSKKILILCLMGWNFYWTVITPFFFPITFQTKGVIRLVEVDLVIYLIYYIFQKIRFERKTFSSKYLATILFLLMVFVGAITLWGYIFAFLNTSFDSWTAAKSRTLNRPCIFPGVDWNDVLHYSTAVISITFIYLMDFIDSNLKRIPNKYIFVF